MHEGPGKRETCPIKAQHLDAQAPGLHLQGTRSTAPLRPDSGMRGELSGYPLNKTCLVQRHIQKSHIYTDVYI